MGTLRQGLKGLRLEKETNIEAGSDILKASARYSGGIIFRLEQHHAVKNL